MSGGEIFVPKIPSMRITDLASALMPDSLVEVVGIRPGEKLHECMIGEDDAPYTFDLGNLYIIRPAIQTWPSNPSPRGEKVPGGFKYSSDLNERWISPDDLRQILSSYKLSGAELVKVEE